MSVKIKNFTIQAKVNEGSNGNKEKKDSQVSYEALESQKIEILEECRELILDILEKKASRI